jgi:hypothetical protein
MGFEPDQIQTGATPSFHAGRTLNSGWPNSTGLPFSTRICVITPLTSALI